MGQYLIVLINKRLVPLVKDVDADRIKTGGGGGLGNKGIEVINMINQRLNLDDCC